jgi:hypothetical protein
MSAKQPFVTALAFRLTAALERYQMHMDALTDPWADRERYALAGRAFDEVRMLKGALPQLSGAMVELLIAHVELVEGLWLALTGRASGDDTSRLRQRHEQAVSRMHGQCVRVFAKS